MYGASSSPTWTIWRLETFRPGTSTRGTLLSAGGSVDTRANTRSPFTLVQHVSRRPLGASLIGRPRHRDLLTQRPRRAAARPKPGCTQRAIYAFLTVHDAGRVTSHEQSLLVLNLHRHL